MDIAQFWARLRAFVAPFHDPYAWALIALCAGGVFLFDPPLAKTVLQWVLLFGVFGGVAVIICRHILREISLADHVKAALSGNIASGLVVLTVGLVLSFLILSLTLWGKA